MTAQISINKSRIPALTSVSPETSTSKLNILIVWDLMINGINPIGLSIRYKNIFRIKQNWGAISEDLVEHIHLTQRGKPVVIAIHIGTNDITNDSCFSLQINLNKIRKLLTELSPSTKILPSSIIQRHNKN